MNDKITLSELYSAFLIQEGRSLPESRGDWQRIEEEMDLAEKNNSFVYTPPASIEQLIEQQASHYKKNQNENTSSNHVSPMSLAARKGEDIFSPEVLEQLNKNKNAARNNDPEKSND